MNKPGAPIPPSHRDLLERPLIAHFATKRPDGSVQSSPMWFLWDGERICMTHTKTRQKFRNILSEPRVALSIVDPENMYRYLEIRGEVERIEDDSAVIFYEKLRRRYGWVHPAREAPYRVVLVIRPTVVLARGDSGIVRSLATDA